MMPLLTRKQFEIEFVRVCERNPRQVGACRVYFNREKRCVLGQVGFNILGKEINDLTNLLPDVSERGKDFNNIISGAIMLNDMGCEWGYMPYLLGLVPGEMPIEDSRFIHIHKAE